MYTQATCSISCWSISRQAEPHEPSPAFAVPQPTSSDIIVQQLLYVWVRRLCILLQLCLVVHLMCHFTMQILLPGSGCPGARGQLPADQLTATAGCQTVGSWCHSQPTGLAHSLQTHTPLPTILVPAEVRFCQGVPDGIMKTSAASQRAQNVWMPLLAHSGTIIWCGILKLKCLQLP